MNMNDYELFGEKFHDKVRKLIKADEIVLPNSIIEADLHTENVRNLMNPIMELIVMHEVIITVNQIRKIEEIARLYLAGSICYALQSRAKIDQYKVYRKTRWKSKAKRFTAQASIAFNLIYAEIGGDLLKNEENIAFQQSKGNARLL